MAEGRGLAAAIEARDAAALAEAGRSVLPVDRDNLVERPWGSPRLLEFKELPAAAGRTFGESFEVAAHSTDPEAREHPSRVRFRDGSSVLLPRLLERAGDVFCGAGFTGLHGTDLPLLPKILAVRQLLSVQVHPPGLPEAYVVIGADPGATLRLGFRRDVSREEVKETLRRGFAAQEALSSSLRELDGARWQELLARNLAAPVPPSGGAAGLTAFARPGVSPAAVLAAVETLRACFWEVLDLMNEIRVEAGMVIDNSRPATRASMRPCADVHALGNPAGKELLLLEVRCPGPTLRAWDHARFPRRPCQMEEALDLLSFRKTEPAEFLAATPDLGDGGVGPSVAHARFCIEHLHVPPGRPVRTAGDRWLQTLHALRGEATVAPESGAPPVALRQGGSAVVGAAAGALMLHGSGGAADLVRVLLPRP